MNEVNKTLFIPLYGKALVSQKGLILSDPTAKAIWEKEAFPLKGKSRSKWLAYNMAMRARVFDDWTGRMLQTEKNALVLHIGCGLDSHCLRVRHPGAEWIDADLPDVIALRRQYFQQNDLYEMRALDAASAGDIAALPDAEAAIVVMEGVSMYLTHAQLGAFLAALQKKYARLHVLMDVYTEFGARASRYKNPVQDVGVTTLYGIDSFDDILPGTGIRVKAEHSLTPERLVNELPGFERALFKLLFAPALYRKIYRLYELEYGGV